MCSLLLVSLHTVYIHCSMGLVVNINILQQKKFKKKREGKDSNLDTPHKTMKVEIFM